MNLPEMPGFNGPYNPDQYNQVPYYTDATGTPYTYDQAMAYMHQQPQMMHQPPPPMMHQQPMMHQHQQQPQMMHQQPMMHQQNTGHINGQELYTASPETYTQDYTDVEPGVYIPPVETVHSTVTNEVTHVPAGVDEYFVTDATLAGNNSCDMCYNSLTHKVISAYNRNGDVKQYILNVGVEMKKSDHVQEVRSIDDTGFDVEETSKAIERSVNTFVDSSDTELTSRVDERTFTGANVATTGLMLGVKFKDAPRGGSVICTASVVTPLSPQIHTESFMDMVMERHPDYNTSTDWYVKLMNAGFGTENPLSVGILNTMDKILMRYARGAVRVSVNVPATVTGAYHTEHSDIVDFLRTKQLDGHYKRAMYEVFKYKLNLHVVSMGDGDDEVNIIATQEDVLLTYVNTSELDNVIAEGYLTHELFPEVRTACVRTAEASRNMDVPSSWFYITNGQGVTIEVRRDMTLAEANTSYRVMRVITQL